MGNIADVIVTRATEGPLAFGPDAGDSLFTPIVAERGLANVATLVTSMGRYEAMFGGTTTHSASDIKYSEQYEVLDAYFAKGGRRAYVVRCVGSAAVAANVTIVDRNGVPEDTLQVEAKGPGTWANLYDVVIADGTIASTFKLSVLDGSGDVVEAFDNLRMDGESMALVNAQSDYVVVTDLGSTTAAPNNRPAIGTVNLNDTTAGVDDNAPAAADIVGTDVSGAKTGLKVFRSRQYGRGFMIAPGLDSDATVVAEIIEQCPTYFRVYLSAADASASYANAVTQRADHDSPFSAFYWPRFKRQDRYTNNIKSISPVGHVIADWAKGIARKGLAKVPAGKDYPINTNSLGLETQASGQLLIDDAIAELCLAQGINPIWDRDRTGPKVWGARAATTESGWKNISTAYVWCYIASNAWTNLQQVIYETQDEQLFLQIRAGVHQFLAGMFDDGAFRGTKPGLGDDPDPEVHGFGVVCDESILSGADIANDNIRVKIWFRDKATAETVFVEVAKNTTS